MYKKKKTYSKSQRKSWFSGFYAGRGSCYGKKKYNRKTKKDSIGMTNFKKAQKKLSNGLFVGYSQKWIDNRTNIYKEVRYKKGQGLTYYKEDTDSGDQKFGRYKIGKRRRTLFDKQLKTWRIFR